MSHSTSPQAPQTQLQIHPSPAAPLLCVRSCFRKVNTVWSEPVYHPAFSPSPPHLTSDGYQTTPALPCSSPRTQHRPSTPKPCPPEDCTCQEHWMATSGFITSARKRRPWQEWGRTADTELHPPWQHGCRRPESRTAKGCPTV